MPRGWTENKHIIKCFVLFWIQNIFQNINGVHTTSTIKVFICRHHLVSSHIAPLIFISLNGHHEIMME